MDPETPTHFNAIIVGTALVESVVAAALSKAGYSVLQLDQSNIYGDEWASLSLQELSEWASNRRGASICSTSPPDELLPFGQRFSLSLTPTLLKATGPAIDVLVRSKVSSYLSFGKLGGIGLWSRDDVDDGKDNDDDDDDEERSRGKGKGEGKRKGKGGKGKIERVPSSKADVFNHPTLSLVEKRRLTKLLLFAAGQTSLKDDPRLSDPNLTLQECLQKTFSLSPSVSQSLAYSLAFCTSDRDLALPSLERLRGIILSSGRYGPSPFLVGHYGGAGDLVGGFSRICAVWGGGQILGRPIEPVILDAKPGIIVPPAQSPFLIHSNVPPPPALPIETETEVNHPSNTNPTTTLRPSTLGIPVKIEPDKPADVFTGDWIVSARSHLPILFPNLFPDDDLFEEEIESVHAIVILSESIPFPTKGRKDVEVDDDDEEEGGEPDSNVFVFAPKEFKEELGTVTVLQVGSGTFACPVGSMILYFNAPLISSSTNLTATELLNPYLEAILALQHPLHKESPLSTITTPPRYSVFYPRYKPPIQSDHLLFPTNFIPTPRPLKSSSAGQSYSLAIGLDEAMLNAEEIFWKIVGEEGKKEGIEFFDGNGKGGVGQEEDEEGEE